MGNSFVDVLFQWCNKDPRCNKLQLTDLLVSPVHHIMKVKLIKFGFSNKNLLCKYRFRFY